MDLSIFALAIIVTIWGYCIDHKLNITNALLRNIFKQLKGDEKEDEEF